MSGEESKSIETPSATPKTALKHPRFAAVVEEDSFDEEDHFYPRVLNATIHPTVAAWLKVEFLTMSNKRMIDRYVHLNPSCNKSVLEKLLSSKPAHFRWGGADLFKVATAEGKRVMVVIETNSCPSGQKSMPGTSTAVSEGYYELMTTSFKPLASNPNLPQGGLAVVYDKNEMEASGYAAAMADVMREKVYYTGFFDGDADPPVKFVDGVMHVRDEASEWMPIRAAFRYVTQKPWNRIPVHTKTAFLNPTLCCLAGGRNKMIADKAYEFFNLQNAQANLCINTPETKRNVSKDEVPLYVRSMGGHAVVKIPYANAGQGVYCITNESELKAFMNGKDLYDKNSSWSSKTTAGSYFHCGSIPNKKNEIFCSDLRMMVMAGEKGFRPVAMYGRRAHKPLAAKLDGSKYDSWSMLGTNLSFKKPDGSWGTDTNRLRLLDGKDFASSGLGMDDLIEAYFQSVFAVCAIDALAARLMAKGSFNMELFSGLLDNDQSLLSEIKID